MPTFNLIDFLDSSIIVWTDHPIYSVLFCGVALVLAWRFAFASKVRIIQRHEMDDREPEPLPVAPERRRLHAIIEITKRRVS